MLVNPWKKKEQAKSLKKQDHYWFITGGCLPNTCKALKGLLLHADEVYEKYANREDVRILVNY